MNQLDELDKKILRILKNDARVSAKSIAEEVFISAPTVATRIENMRKNGIINGFYTDINEDYIGNFIKAFINMEVMPSSQEELYKKLRRSAHVKQCSKVTGEYSLLIEVIFRSTEELDKFIGEMQHFGRTKTQIVFSTIVKNHGIILD